MHLRYTLLTDGPSDKVLLYPIDWLFREIGIATADGVWADLRVTRNPPRTLNARIDAAVALHACHLLFVHRDAEGDAREVRVREIQHAVESSESKSVHVCVVPVRMTEAWLLHDESAIRAASGNPNGRAPLVGLPDTGYAEQLMNPKKVLNKALLDASELHSQRRQRAKSRLGRMRHRVAELIEDYGSLRRLPAFAELEAELRSTLEGLRDLPSAPDR